MPGPNPNWRSRARGERVRDRNLTISHADASLRVLQFAHWSSIPTGLRSSLTPAPGPVGVNDIVRLWFNRNTRPERLVTSISGWRSSLTAGCAVLLLTACGDQRPGLDVGRGSFMFYDSLGNVDLPINVRYYMPQDFER